MVNLEFVSISHPDDMKKRETRRKIGQHVMKDIGYSRRKGSRKSKVNEPAPQKETKEEAAAQVQALSKAIRSDAQSKVHSTPGFETSPFTTLSRNLAARSTRIENLCEFTFVLLSLVC